MHSPQAVGLRGMLFLKGAGDYPLAINFCRISSSAGQNA